MTKSGIHWSLLITQQGALKLGYDVHITRAQHWTESELNPIHIEEWLSYIASDPEMRLDNSAEATAEGDLLRYDNDGLAVWIAFSGHGIDGNMAWFDYRQGAIVVKNPEEEILGKMKIMADALQANLIGDDGEFY